MIHEKATDWRFRARSIIYRKPLMMESWRGSWVVGAKTAPVFLSEEHLDFAKDDVV